MIINERKFPILSCMQRNMLTEGIANFVNRQVPDKNEQKEILESADFFKDRNLTITYITPRLHQELQITANFLPAKKILKDSATGAGVLLLPETLYPDFTNVPEYANVDSKDYPIDAILYSWLSINDHDKHFSNYNTEDPWEKDEDRELFILPVYQDGTTQATKRFEMTNNDELYGWPFSDTEGRAWYGKIHDYVMSYILCTTDTNDKLNTISADVKIPHTSTQTYLNDNSNLIEILSTDDLFK